MLKLLVLYPRYFWECKMSSVRRHSIMALMASDDCEAKLSGIGWHNYADGLSVEENRKRIMPDCDAVLWYKPLGAKGVSPLLDVCSLTVPAILRFNECWWPHGIAAKEVQDTGTQIVICHHVNDMERIGERFAHRDNGDKSMDFPNPIRVWNNSQPKVTINCIHHCAEKSVYANASRPWKDRDIDILLTGVTGDEHYPLRTRFKNMIDSGKLPGAVIRQHPGYRTKSLFDNNHQVSDYANQLGRSKIVLCCTSKWKYALAKQVEAAMAGAFVVTDCPDECLWYQELWTNVTGGINPSLSDDDITDKIKRIAGMDYVCENLASDGRHTALSHFTQEHYAQRFIDAVNGSLEK